MWRAPVSKAIRATAARPAWRRSAGRKGSPYARGKLYVADTENHVIRRIDLKTGLIRPCSARVGAGTVQNPIPFDVRSRGRMVCCVDARGVLYVGDSEAHRIRTLS